MNIEQLFQQPDATIIDVREPFEFEEGHIERSLNIPLNQVMPRLEELQTMGRPLIMVCRSGNRSGLATMLMQAQGVSEVYNGGAWDEAPLTQVS